MSGFPIPQPEKKPSVGGGPSMPAMGASKDFSKGVKFQNTNLPDVIELKGIGQSYDSGKSFMMRDLNMIIEDKPNQGQFVVILGVSGCGKCVGQNTWIRTPHGIRRISDLVKHEKGLHSIQLPLLVEGKTERADHSFCGGTKKTRIFNTVNGDEFEAGLDHPVNVWVEESFCVSKKLAKDVKIGDILLKDDRAKCRFVNSPRIPLPWFKIPQKDSRNKIKRVYRSCKSAYKTARLADVSVTTVYRVLKGNLRDLSHFKRPKYLSKATAYFLGLLQGDGCCTSKQYSITTMDSEIREFVQKYLKNYLGIGSTITKKKGTKAVCVRPLEEPYFDLWAQSIFKGYCDANTKKVPKIIRTASFNIQVAYIQGVFDTDGSKSKDDRVEISLNSKDNIDFICEILSALNITYKRTLRGRSHRVSLRTSHLDRRLFKLPRKKTVPRGRLTKYQSHVDVIPGSLTVIERAFKEHRNKGGTENTYIKSILKRGKDVLRCTYNRVNFILSYTGTQLPQLPNFSFIKIKSVLKSQSVLYDLSNPISHHYCANGYLTHNSTILRFICGLQKPTEGQVLIKGKVRDESLRIGMVFQQYSSFPWLSVLDNVALGLNYKGVSKKERHARAREMIRLVGLEGHEKKFAKYPILSGGQLQRVAIARSLVSDPEILLMDEPFGALDINTRLQMQDLLCEIWTRLQTTVVFVTHDIPEAVYLGDEIQVMRANPANIVERIQIDLPLARNRGIKREKRFMDLVYQVEDTMVNVQNFMDQEKNGKK